MDLFSERMKESGNKRNYMKYLINRLALDTQEVRSSTITVLGQTALFDEDFKVEIKDLFESLL